MAIQHVQAPTHLLLRVHLAKAGGGGGHGGPPAVLDAQVHVAPGGLRWGKSRRSKQNAYELIIQ